MIGISQPLAHATVRFILDEVKYEVEHFNINFHQSTDYKGQPQHEVKGGQLIVVLSQAADSNLYDWARRSTKLKDAMLTVETGSSNAILRIVLTNTYCTKLIRNTDAFSGTQTTLFLAPEQVTVNDVMHTNYWER